MNTRTGIALLLGIVFGFALSFLGYGLMWIGLNPALQGLNAFLFLALAYGVGRATRSYPATCLAVAAGAFPVAALLTQFRDKNDSHLVGILLAGSWIMGIALGSWVGSRHRPKT